MTDNIKTNGLDASAWARAPPQGSCCTNFLKAIYNPEEKSFLGRTAKRWGIVLVFYTVFYAALALLFAICMGVLLLTIDDNKPKYTLHQSLIGSNPGVAYRPLPADTWILKLDRDNSSHTEAYSTQLQEFLKQYPEMANPECGLNDTFGYPDTPCIFIKLNKVFDWKPEVYTEPEAGMPEDLVNYIQGLKPLQRNQIWVSCWEEDGNSTKLTYPWGRGLAASYYPYVNAMEYRSPVVAVRVVPAVNTLAVVRCRVWAKNIEYNKSMKEPSGYTRIQVLVRDTTQDEVVN